MKWVRLGYCPKCGKDVDADYCDECGAYTQEPVEEEDVNGKQRPTKTVPRTSSQTGSSTKEKVRRRTPRPGKGFSASSRP